MKKSFHLSIITFSRHPPRKYNNNSLSRNHTIPHLPIASTFPTLPQMNLRGCLSIHPSLHPSILFSSLGEKSSYRYRSVPPLVMRSSLLVLCHCSRLTRTRTINSIASARRLHVHRTSYIIHYTPYIIHHTLYIIHHTPPTTINNAQVYSTRIQHSLPFQVLHLMHPS